MTIRNELPATVAGMALNLRKAAPKARWQAIQILIQALQESGTQLDNKALGALATLYAGHMPKPSKEPKSVFDWVAKAAGVKDARPYLTVVHIIEGVMYASDGHRMHTAPAQGLENGIYDVAGNWLADNEGRVPGEEHPQLPQQAKAPDFKRLMFDPAQYIGRTLNADCADASTLGELRSQQEKGKAMHTIDLPGKVAIKGPYGQTVEDCTARVQLNYLEDAMTSRTLFAGSETMIHTRGPSDTVMLECTSLQGVTCKAVIMPVRQ